MTVGILLYRLVDDVVVAAVGTGVKIVLSHERPSSSKAALGARPRAVAAELLKNGSGSVYASRGLAVPACRGRWLLPADCVERTLVEIIGCVGTFGVKKS